MIRYRIVAADPHAHLFEVTMRIEAPDRDGQQVALPAWIPGSYLIREFARHIVRIEAHSKGRSVPLQKLDKHTWQAGRVADALELRYWVYAWDLSVRAAHLDATHGFFNGTSVFLRAVGRDDVPCEVRIDPPAIEAGQSWRVMTTLPAQKVDARGFGLYTAPNYDELVDHPVEMGTWAHARFDAGGAVHDIALTGRHDGDLRRFATDLKKVCTAQIRLFEPRSKRAPVNRYAFLISVVGDGYGGLEHRASTALLTSRASLPWIGMRDIGDDYRRLLGLASHEYFHTWHVKRIKPAAFARYDFGREQYTRLLWVFEGFTSYYDDLMLARSGLLDAPAYLRALSETLGAVMRAPGRSVQSVAESSFDAWIKYYRQDENSPNTVVSYYAKGALVALALDLAIRARTRGERSLDDLMRLMWQRYGRNFERDASGVDEEAMAGLIEEATGVALRRELAQWAHGTAELPLARLLDPFGITIEYAAPAAPSSLGVRTAQKNGELSITTCLTGGAAQRAGLSAGDTIVALDGLRASEASMKTLLARRKPGQRVAITAFRRDELMQFDVELGPPDVGAPSIRIVPRAPAAVRRLRDGWLGATNSVAAT